MASKRVTCRCCKREFNENQVARVPYVTAREATFLFPVCEKCDHRTMKEEV